MVVIGETKAKSLSSRSHAILQEISTRVLQDCKTRSDSLYRVGHQFKGKGQTPRIPSLRLDHRMGAGHIGRTETDPDARATGLEAVALG